MTEPSDPSKKSKAIAHLLFKAVKELPEEEQEAVLEYLFEQAIGTARPSFGEAQLQETFLRRLGAEPLSTLFTAQRPTAAQQMIPVRLSEASHRRLKQWCEEHDFHMSVVVRGLIERFLDGWEERSA